MLIIAEQLSNCNRFYKNLSFLHPEAYKSLFLRLLNELYYLRFAQTQNSIQKLFCNFCFGHLLQLAHFAVRKQEFNDIGIRVKSCPLQSESDFEFRRQSLPKTVFLYVRPELLEYQGFYPLRQLKRRQFSF